MRSRNHILSSLPLNRLRHLARVAGVLVAHSVTKARCVSALASSSHTTTLLLENLTARDLSQLCRKLDVTPKRRTKAGMIESIIGTSPTKLRRNVIRSLKSIGFSFTRGRPTPPCDDDKEKIRQLHSAAVAHRRKRAQPSLMRKESVL